ncbi:MAG: LysR family transcriptional regulator [Candidatus Cryptobacteroides sp.]
MFEDFRLRVFVTVAECGSFTEAAKILGISQPAVSQNISALETAMGDSLFVRSYASVSLTDAGRIVYDFAKRILSLYAHLDAVQVKKTETPESPVLLKLNGSSDAQVSVFDGEIRIKML